MQGHKVMQVIPVNADLLVLFVYGVVDCFEKDTCFYTDGFKTSLVWFFKYNHIITIDLNI